MHRGILGEITMILLGYTFIKIITELLPALFTLAVIKISERNRIRSLINASGSTSHHLQTEEATQNLTSLENIHQNDLKKVEMYTYLWYGVYKEFNEFECNFDQPSLHNFIKFTYHEKQPWVCFTPSNAKLLKHM